ncbi:MULTISPECIES: hypothetical protein [unclassified Nocardia]|uniref:hypothetical protein n=1 Tax=Nocardia sp. NPDC019255 TaxID=3154591 RepID=UPI0033E5ED7C
MTVFDGKLGRHGFDAAVAWSRWLDADCYGVVRDGVVDARRQTDFVPTTKQASAAGSGSPPTLR